MSEENWKEVKKEIALHDKKKCGCRNDDECSQKRADLARFMENAYYLKKKLDERWGS
jgi:hypothetical protein